MKLIKQLSLNEQEKHQLFSLYKRINITLSKLSFQNPQENEYVDKLLLQTIKQVPEIFYVVDNKNKISITQKQK